MFSSKNFFIEIFFIKKKNLSNKFIKKKLISKKNCVKFFSPEEKIILSLFLYKHLQVYYVYLQTLYKVLVTIFSSHVFSYGDITWS